MPDTTFFPENNTALSSKLVLQIDVKDNVMVALQNLKKEEMLIQYAQKFNNENIVIQYLDLL